VFVAVRTATGAVVQRSAPASQTDQLLRQVDSLPPGDLYVFQNGFRALSTGTGTWHYARDSDHLCELRALYLDLDCHRANLLPGECSSQVEEYVRQGRLPAPHLLTHSGRGLAVTWLLQPVPVPPGGRVPTAWTEAMGCLLDTCPRQWGADPSCRDAARLLRLAGSVNHKNGQPVEVFGCPSLERYPMSQFPLRSHTVVSVSHPQPVRPSFRAWKRRPGDGAPAVLMTPNTLRLARMADLECLAALRGERVEGCRAVLLHLFVHVGMYGAPDGAKAEAEARARALAARFAKPLPPRESDAQIRRALAKCEVGAYRYSNASLIRCLQITPEEQQRLTTIIDAAERRLRRSANDSIRARVAPHGAA